MSGSGWALTIALVVGLGAFLVFMTFYVNRQRAMIKSRQDPCDYVVFEALPSHLPLLEADLADHRWRLAESGPFRSGTFLYQFEKVDSHSALLSDVLDFENSMKRTSNRKTDAHIPIRIKAQGLKSELDADGRHPALRGHLL